MSAIPILGGLLLLLGSGIPVAFALGGLGLALLVYTGLPPLIVAQGLFASMDNFIYLAVPLFLLMSNILLKAGVGRDLFAATQSWVGHWPGGMAVATILSCGLFAAISGSSVATAATIGTVAVPELVARGYPRSFVTGLLAAGGTLGILIPPSIPMIIYGVITEQSVLDLFLGGIGPGLLLVVLFTLVAILHALWRGQGTIKSPAPFRQRLRASLRALPVAGLALVIVLGLYSGAFTPTEASAVGVALALLIAIGRIDRKRFFAAVMESMTTTATIFTIVFGAKTFAMAVTLMQLPQDMASVLMNMTSSAPLFLLAVCILLLVLGFFLEAVAMLLIVVPVLLPALYAFGVDPVWFGILFVIMIECAMITPPVGLNLFVIQSIAGCDLQEVVRGIWPFLLSMLLVAATMGAVPELVYLPIAWGR